MYEVHFGLTGAPFQLNPDPSFYFDSRGHSHALAYLKFGVHQGEGFIVVTGEIGAGKTTLVRTLLEGLDSNELVAAQVLNTQLESGELLQSILTAFGVAPEGGHSKANLLASLEAFLTSIAAQGRRALLVVDEAQNLGAEAIEELRMLSNFQIGNHALLQSFLVGQPELRRQLESRTMEQLRQRVLASCHLGPLTQEETRAYVEHRLRHVGWANRPSFDEAAFGSIYGWTGGIPRKINLLCNRLLLAAYLNDANEIGVDLVELTGREIVRETGGTRAIPEAAPNVALPLAVVPPGPVEEAELAEPADVESEFSVLTSQLEYVWRACHQLDDLVRPLVCVADSPLSYLKIATLAKALKVDGGLPPVVLVNPGQVHEVEAEQLPDDLIEAVAAEIHLGVTGGTVAERLGSIALRFGEVSRQLVPSAAITCGSTDAVLTCALVAGKARMPLGRLGAGQRIGSQRHATDLNAALVDRMSDILYTPMLKTHYALYREGIAAERMVCVGSLLADGLHQVTANMPPVSEHLKGLGLSRDQLRRALRGFALVTAQADEDELSTSDLTQVARVARDLGKETLVVWPVSEATSRSIAAGKANALLQRSGVVLVPRPRYADQIGLVRGATCVIAGPGWSCVEEADCLDIPSIVLYPGGDVPTAPPGGVIAKIPCDSVACVRALHEILERGRPEDELADDARGAASARVLEHLRRWLPTKALPIKASPR